MIEIRPGVWQSEAGIALERYFKEHVIRMPPDFSVEINGVLTQEGVDWAKRMAAEAEPAPREKAFSDWWEGVGPWVPGEASPEDIAHEAFCAGVEWEQNRE